MQPFGAVLRYDMGMNVIKPVGTADGQLVGYSFECPGCKDMHVVYTEATASKTTWDFNGDLEKPTFNPSYLTWLDPNPNALPEPRFKKYRDGFRCHSFIRDGMIEFLSDCTHQLAGKTVKLPEVSE